MAKLKPVNPDDFWPWYASRIPHAPKHRQQGLWNVLREHAPDLAR
jgi:hypothetical protein